MEIHIVFDAVDAIESKDHTKRSKSQWIKYILQMRRGIRSESIKTQIIRQDEKCKQQWRQFMMLKCKHFTLCPRPLLFLCLQNIFCSPASNKCKILPRKQIARQKNNILSSLLTQLCKVVAGVYKAQWGAGEIYSRHTSWFHFSLFFLRMMYTQCQVSRILKKN